MGSLEGMKLRKSSILTPIRVVTEKVVELQDEPLSPMALMFHKPDSNVYIVTIFGTNCMIDQDHLKANLDEFVLSHPRLYSLQVEDEKKGGLRWVQTEVDLDRHIIMPDINPTLITSSPEKFLEDYLYNLSQKKIDMSKPLWDIHILNGFKTSIPATKSIGILRMHHSLGDGMSLMSLMLSLAKKTSDNMPLPITEANNKNPMTRNIHGNASSKRSICMIRLERFINGWRLIWNTLVDVIYFLATIFFLKDTKNPLTPPANIGDTPKRIVQRTVSLDDIKFIARATKTTVNDVVLGVTEAGLSRYLNNVSEESVTRTRSMRLRAAVFFNIRVLSGFHVVEKMKVKGSLARWGNQIGYVFHPLKVGMRRNPLEYVHSAKCSMDGKKASLVSSFSYLFTHIMLKLFGIQAVKFSRNISLYYSNMMGPKEKVSLFGYPITYIATSCHGAPTGLLIHAISYVDKLTFSLAVDERVVPDPHQLCDDLEESLNIIKQAVILAQ